MRTSFTLPQSTVPMADWAAKNGIKKVVTLVSDYGPGIDAEKAFSEQLQGRRRRVVENLRVPLRNPDFAPFLQKAADAKPDALFVFVPSGVGRAVHEAVRRARPRQVGHQADRHRRRHRRRPAQRHGRRRRSASITTHHYSAATTAPENKAFVEAFKKANNGMRPNFMAVGGYDGMHLIYEALKKTNGATDGEKLIEAMKGMTWKSPRGPISIDPETRDIIQNIYIRKVEKVGGELYNVEFATIPNVKDPVKAGKK